MPDDMAVIGKKVFYADNWFMLITDVESGNTGRTDTLLSIDADSSHPFGTPFETHRTRWRFAYYDPDYETKVAYSQGKTIEYRSKDGTGDSMWHVSTEGVVDPKYYDYRVKPEEIWYVHPYVNKDFSDKGTYYKDTNDYGTPSLFEGTEEECDAWIAEHTPKTRRMTNKELARWLAEGRGQARHISRSIIVVSVEYDFYEENNPVKNDIRIREWDSDQWHEPLVEVKE